MPKSLSWTLASTQTVERLAMVKMRWVVSTATPGTIISRSRIVPSNGAQIE